MTRADRFIDTNQTELAGVYDGLKQSLRRADTALSALSTEFAGLATHSDERLADLHGRLIIIMQQLETTTIHLNRFVDLIASQPSQLVFGQPPPRRSLPADEADEGNR